MDEAIPGVFLCKRGIEGAIGRQGEQVRRSSFLPAAALLPNKRIEDWSSCFRVRGNNDPRFSQRGKTTPLPGGIAEKLAVAGVFEGIERPRKLRDVSGPDVPCAGKAGKGTAEFRRVRDAFKRNDVRRRKRLKQSRNQPLKKDGVNGFCHIARY